MSAGMTSPRSGAKGSKSPGLNARDFLGSRWQLANSASTLDAICQSCR